MFLDAAQFTAVRQAALASGLITAVPRTLLLQGLPPGFIAGLVLDPSPLNQFSLDLAKLVAVERLAGGIVPIVTFLRNAASELALRDMPEAKLFEELANAIGNRTQGSAVASLPEPSHLPEVIQKEVIVGRDDMVDFGFLGRALAAGRSVARILVPRFVNGAQVRVPPGGQPWLARGTAWIIAPGLAITNHHVINARTDGEADAAPADFVSQATNATLEFDFDREGAAVASVGVTELVHASSGLDYAILRVAGDPASRPPLFLRPGLVQMNATTYMAVNIIQHPRGAPKRLAFRNNLVSAADADLLRYFTDTDAGSSGAAVCDDNWAVVALHRGAKFAKDVSYQGKDTAYVNFGSQIQAILAELSKLNTALHGAITGSQPR